MENNQPKILGVIPARFASTRFMGKPLVEIAGKTMIQRVIEQALKAKTLHRVVVATDDERIFEHVQSLGYEVVMTNESHQSGTDRIAEVAQMYAADGYDAIVNIQGDEPFIQPEQIDLVVETIFEFSDVLDICDLPVVIAPPSPPERGELPSELRNDDKNEKDIQNASNDVQNSLPSGGLGGAITTSKSQKTLTTDIATLAKKITTEESLHNPNVVKVVFGILGNALYFSRHTIPFLRSAAAQKNPMATMDFYQHIGLYAYKTDVLLQLAQLPQSRLELAESLEQLRWLEHGFRIRVGITNLETFGIDTPEDLEKALSHIKNNPR